MIKSSKQSKDLTPAKHALQEVLDRMKTVGDLRSTDVSIDVDP
jgi:hypothetical protein